MLKRLAVVALVAGLASAANAADTINAVAACGAAGSLVIPLGTIGGYTATTFDLSSANQNGTIGFFATGPRALTWQPILVTPLPAGAPVATVVGTGSAVTFQGIVQTAGYTSLCLTATAWTGGSTTVSVVPLVGQWEPLFLDIPTGNSTGLFGTVTAPTAGQAVVTTTPGANTYDVVVSIYLGPSAAAADADNFALKVGATTVMQLPFPPVANSLPVVYSFRRIAVPAATAVSVNAIGAGTAAVPYKASIQLTPVN